jgi:hypothetical protein
MVKIAVGCGFVGLWLLIMLSWQWLITPHFGGPALVLIFPVLKFVVQVLNR